MRTRSEKTAKKSLKNCKKQEQKIWKKRIYPHIHRLRGGGRLNRKNIVVSRPENPLNKGKSSNFDTAKITPKTQQNYSENESLICAKINNKKSRIENNYINITLFGSKCNQQTQNENDFEKKTNKTKLFALIFSLFFVFSTLLASGLFLIANYVNKTNTNATTTGSYTSIGNLLKDSNTVNYDTYQALLSKLGNDTTSTRNKSSIDSGNAVVFQMGKINSKPIYWQVVYQAGDIITVWMTDCYTLSIHNQTTGTTFVKYPNTAIRTKVQDIYNKQKSSYAVLDNITVSPNDTTKMPQAYRNAQAVDGKYGGYNSNTGDNTLSNISDKYWLVSNYEAFSLWGLTVTDKGFSNTTLDGSSVDYCWLRSGYTDQYGSSSAVLVGRWGDRSSSSYPQNSNGVRPAAHLSLNALYEASGNKISASTTNTNVDKTLANYIPNSNTDITFIFTPNTNYYINSIKIGATDGSPAQTNVTINASAPSSYSTLGSGSCVYKVYRDGNTVKVVINQATEAITITGGASARTITFSSGSNISNASWSRADYNTITATISATVSSGYYPQFSYNSSDNIKMPAAAGSGGIGSVGYSYTFSSNVLNLTLTNLPTGFNSIPTLSLTAYTLDSNNLIVNVSNAIYEIIYESTQIVVNVMPNSSYYITQAYTNSNTPEDIKYIMGTLVQTGNAHAIIYYANQNTSKVTFVLRDLSGDLTLNIVTGNNKPDLATSGGTQIDGVACYAENGGEARMVGYANDDTAVTFIAVPYANYQFDGWFIQGETTALNTNLSCTLDMSIIKGKIIVAHFSKTTNKTNTDTNTPDTGGFV